MHLPHADLRPPRFAAASPIVVGALAELRYPEKISISKAANDLRELDNPAAYSGPWRDSPHSTGFMVRAMDALNQDSPYNEVVVMGPAQTGKSEVGNNWQLHTIIYDPADMLFVMPDRIGIEQYVKVQWNKMVELTPKLQERLVDGGDTMHLKQFRGCAFFFRWPSGPAFRTNPISRGRLDDYDDIPEDIGTAAEGKDGQGDALSLLFGRGGSFSPYGGTKAYVNSTPKLGKKRGIEALVAAGTDERWYVDCPACGEPFILDTEERLHFDRTGTALDAAESAIVLCPDPACGGFYQQRDKRAMMDNGRWVGRGETAISRSKAPEGKTGEPIPNSRLSQRWDGLMGFRRWSEMAEQWRKAELSFENEQDEKPLKVFFQTVIGKNYVERGSGDQGASESELLKRAKASTWRFRSVPREARCVVMAVDQAVNRFEVGAWAFGPGFRAWLIDRFQIVNCGEEPLRPFTRPEHFAVLYDRVLSKTYPVAGAPELLVKPLCTVLDTGGMDGATDNAFDWWHSMVRGDVGSGRKPVPETAITLFKGGNNSRGKLLPPPTIDAKRQMKGAPVCELYIPNVSRIKDMADVGLRRGDGGPGSIGFPGDLDRHGELVAAPYIAEMKAETKVGEQWERPPNTPNETLDTYVMARTALLRFGGHDHSLDWVPAWARPPRAFIAPAAPMPARTIPDSTPAEIDRSPAMPRPTRPAQAQPGARPRVRIVRSR